MKKLLRLKFSDDWLKTLLLETKEEALIEGNTWHDNYWGQCNCGNCNCGQNMLGKLLMEVREELKQTRTESKNPPSE